MFIFAYPEDPQLYFICEISEKKWTHYREATNAFSGYGHGFYFDQSRTFKKMRVV